MDTSDAFDQKIVLDQPYKVLIDDEFLRVAEVVEPLIKTMYAALQHLFQDS